MTQSVGGRSAGTQPQGHLFHHDSSTVSVSRPAEGHCDGSGGKGHGKFNHLPRGKRQKSCKNGENCIKLEEIRLDTKKKTGKKKIISKMSYLRNP